MTIYYQGVFPSEHSTKVRFDENVGFLWDGADTKTDFVLPTKGQASSDFDFKQYGLPPYILEKDEMSVKLEKLEKENELLKKIALPQLAEWFDDSEAAGSPS